MPAPVYSWWPRGATLLNGGSAPEAPSVPTGNVPIENAPDNVSEEAPNETSGVTPAPEYGFSLDLSFPEQYGSSYRMGENPSPEYMSCEDNALNDNIAPTVLTPALSLSFYEKDRR